MTNVPIEEQLGFDISQALQGIGQIDDALTQVVQSFQVGLASALETLTGIGADVPPLAETLDVPGLGSAVENALQDAAASPLPVEADTAGLDASIADALDVPRDVAIEGDTAPLVDAIADATSATETIPIEADVSGAVEAIDSLEGETVTVSVEADTAGAQDELGALGDAATGAGSRVFDLGVTTSGFAAISALGRGEVGGLTSGLGLLGGSAIAVGSAVSAGAASVGVFFGQAVGAQAAVQRLEASMGPLASRIEQLEVGDLNTDLSELALSLGSDDDALRNVAATLFNFQTGAGTAAIEASKFAEGVLALSSRAVALNPALGSIEAVAGRLGNVLGRGGRFASQFGINLSSTEIKARAAANATQGLGDGVSFASLQIAGGQIAIERYGDSLTDSIAEGTRNPIIQLSALRQKFEEAAEAIGQPLVAPIFEILQAIEPVAEGLGRALGSLAEVLLPFLADLGPLFSGLAVGLNAVSRGLEGVGTLLAPLATPIGEIAIGLGLLTAAAYAAGPALQALAVAGGLSLGPVGWVVLGVGALAALGAALGLFGDNTRDATIDTSALNTAFDVSSTTAAGFASVLDNLNASIADYLTSSLAVGDEGRTGLDTANALGVGYDQLADALGGTDAEYQRFRNDLAASNEAQQIGSDQAQHFFDILEEGRGTLQDNARATLLGAVATGVLSQRQLDQANAANRAVGFNDDYGNAIVDNIEVLRDLAPAIDAATQRTNANAQATIAASPAYAQLVRDLATGAITTDTFASSLEQFGFVGTGAADQAKAVSEALSSLISSANSALPTVGGAIDTFQQNVQTSFQQVVDDIENGTGNVEEDLKRLADNQDPQRFADNLNAQAAQIAGFAGNLALLVAQGFGTLAAELAAKGPEAAAGLAAGLASDPAKAQVAASSLVLRDAAVNNFDTLLREKFPQLQGLGGEIGGQVNKGIAGTIGKDGSIQTAILKLSPEFVKAQGGGPKVEVPEPDVDGAKAAGEQTGQAAQTGFTDTFQPAAAATAAVQQVPPAITTGMQPAISAATQAGVDVTRFFADQLHFGGEVTENMGSIPGRIGRASEHNNLFAAQAGLELGIAYGEGFAGGISSAIGIAATAAATLAAAADRAARRRLGIESPSKAGKDLGRQYVAGVVQGLQELDPLHAATAALTLALIPDLRPALKQVPQLAPGIVAAAPISAAQALVGTSTSADVPISNPADRRVEATITLNKTDPDPKHFADELAWMIQ